MADNKKLLIKTPITNKADGGYTLNLPDKDGDDYTIATIDDIPANSNIENGAGTNAVQEKMTDVTVNFAGRNPNAEALDETLDDEPIPTGASGNQSAAFGKNTMALATASFTNGNKTLAKGEESHAEGYQSVTLGNGSHAEGNTTVTVGDASHAEGFRTQAIGNNSHAEGDGTISIGDAAHSEGFKSKAGKITRNITALLDTNTKTFEIGEGTITINNAWTEYGTISASVSNGSIVVNISGIALSSTRKSLIRVHYSVSGGEDPDPMPVDTDDYREISMSHAEGIASESFIGGSHAEGSHTIAANEGAHAEGIYTEAYGLGSHASGFRTIAKRAHQTAIGQYNDNKSNTLFEVGNGTSASRDNAFEVYEDGHATVGGKTIATTDDIPAIYLRSAQTTVDTLTITPSSGDAIIFNNYYPNRSYTSGLQISTANHQNYANGALFVPNATASQAGVVTTEDQTFAGDKVFTNGVFLNSGKTSYLKETSGVTLHSTTSLNLTAGSSINITPANNCAVNIANGKINVKTSIVPAVPQISFSDSYINSGTTITANYTFPTLNKAAGDYTIATTDDITNMYSYDDNTGILTINLD